jgi:hypothetical protein
MSITATTPDSKLDIVPTKSAIIRRKSIEDIPGMNQIRMDQCHDMADDMNALNCTPSGYDYIQHISDMMKVHEYIPNYQGKLLSISYSTSSIFLQ